MCVYKFYIVREGSMLLASTWSTLLQVQELLSAQSGQAMPMILMTCVGPAERSTNLGRLPEDKDSGRSSLLNGRRQQSASDSSDSEDEHIEVIEVDQPPPSSLQPQAPQPNASSRQPAGVLVCVQYL